MRGRVYLFIVLALSVSGCSLLWPLPHQDPHRVSEPFLLSSRTKIGEILRDRGRVVRLFTLHRAKDRDAIDVPDNSLLGISRGGSTGALLLEVDVRMNREGTLFLFHDGSLRAVNATFPDALLGRQLSSLSNQELAEVFHPSPYHERIPRFDEALYAVRPWNTALQLDIKQENFEVLDRIVQTLVTSDQTHQVLLQLKSLKNARYVRERYPNLAIDIRCRSFEALRDAVRLKPEVVEFEGWTSEEGISLAHEAGSRVLINVAGTFRDRPFFWKRLFRQGVDIIMTDRSEAMVAFLGEQES